MGGRDAPEIAGIRTEQNRLRNLQVKIVTGQTPPEYGYNPKEPDIFRFRESCSQWKDITISVSSCILMAIFFCSPGSHLHLTRR